MIQAQGQNQENNNSKEGMSIRRALQEKKGENHPTTPASRIIQKTSQGMGKNQQYTMKLAQNSSRTQIRTENPQNLPRPLKAQNSQTQLSIRQKISKNENQPQVQTQPQPQPQGQGPQFQSRYSRRVVDSSVHNDSNKEIKIINKNNNYTINVTNNNNTINVNNNTNNDINDNNYNTNEKFEDVKDKEDVKEEIIPKKI